jgi:hypothetical protein
VMRSIEQRGKKLHISILSKDVDHKMTTVNSAPLFVDIGPGRIANESSPLQIGRDYLSVAGDLNVATKGVCYFDRSHYVTI